jgi:hypothetical protein
MVPFAIVFDERKGSEGNSRAFLNLEKQVAYDKHHRFPLEDTVKSYV